MSVKLFKPDRSEYATEYPASRLPTISPGDSNPGLGAPPGLLEPGPGTKPALTPGTLTWAS